MNDLQTFLADLALDPKKFADFLREPEAAMGRASLSQEDRAALLSGIPAMIYARLAQYLAYPPPYYTPVTLLLNAAFPRPNFVTMPPLVWESRQGGGEYQPPINFVTIAPLYVTAAPPLYIPAFPSPNFVTTIPPVFAPEKQREAPAPPPAPKPPPKRR